ncbi:hypothetical protein [uncultured Psychroserpens sp.]|uniref:hypothetical protein n=1 Tax=uncultured Psychroserpens sp. TaxID=255436 RepID=UPI002624C53B|nr:hypothetical protein [uncultured Psychroserpens sp.]
MKKYIILLLIMVCYSCGIDNSKVETLNWKHGGGHHVGDMISFEDDYEIKNDTIYKNETPVGIKVSTIRRLDNSQVLIIKAIKKDQTGTYHAK